MRLFFSYLHNKLQYRYNQFIRWLWLHSFVLTCRMMDFWKECKEALHDRDDLLKTKAKDTHRKSWHTFSHNDCKTDIPSDPDMVILSMPTKRFDTDDTVTIHEESEHDACTPRSPRQDVQS